jgi:hypothetical protein
LDVLSDIHRLCQASESPAATTTNASEKAQLITGGTRLSSERVWRLLTECPQISIGLNRQFNTLTLADLWDHPGTALARVCFLLPTVTQDRNKVAVEAVVGYSLSSAPRKRSSETPAPQATTLGPITPSIVDQKQDATRQGDIIASIEPTYTASNERTPFSSREGTSGAFDWESQHALREQSTDIASRQAGFRSPETTRPSSSRNTAESFATESPNRPSLQPSYGIGQYANADHQGSLTPTRRRDGSKIDLRFRPQRTAEEPAVPPKQGGPRKYLRGTEGFWNEMFWHARNQCEGQVTGRFTAGIATHPGARALYAKRPAGIDAVILRALDTGLPVPIYPEDITDDWRDRTAWVLNRSQHGVYVTPEGVRRVDSSQYANHSEMLQSRIMVLRSERLQEVNFSNRTQHLNGQYSPASAAHTVRHLGFFSLQHTATTGPFGPELPKLTREKNISFLVSEPNPEITHGPPLGLFDGSNEDGSDIPMASTMLEAIPTTPTPRDRRERDSAGARPTLTSDSISRATTIGLGTLGLAGERHLSPVEQSWRGLPPPLTTRSRKRKMSEHAESAKQPPKRRRQIDKPAEVSKSHVAPVTLTEERSQDSSGMLDVDTSIAPIIRNIPPEQIRPPKPKAAPRKMLPGNRKDLVKKILLEVIDECGGMIPNEYACISEYMTTKYRAEGKSGQPDKKICKDVITSLCTNGWLKRLAFTFQRKSGAMATGKILANANLDAKSEAVIRLQQNIINALPDLYVPPLGSVLNAPSIEAPLPDTPPATPLAEKIQSTGKTPARIATTRRLRNIHGTRTEHFGCSPARRPFTWQGSPQLVSLQGSEDDLSLAFAYMTASWTQRGRAIWTNAEAGPIDEVPSPAKRKIDAPETRIGATIRNLPAPDTTANTSAEVQVGNLNWRTERPVTSLTFDPEARTAPVNEDTTAAGGPRFGRSSRGRKIIWKTRDSDVLPPSLPASLQDILDMPGQIPRIDYSQTEEPDTNFFYWELDAVEYWEGNVLKIYQQQASEWTFINHISKQRSIVALPGYPLLKWEEPIILASATFAPHPTHIKRGKLAQKQKPQKAPVEQDDESVDSDYDPTIEGAAPFPLRRSRRKSSTQPARRSNEPATRTRRVQRQYRPLREDGQPAERKGRPRILQTMATEEIYHIIVAVIVVRTLVGGITGDINWSIVHKLCPNRDEIFLADRWSTLLVKSRQDIANLTESMQKKYIVAYEKEEVPCINFDDVEHSDWDAIVSWAERNLDKIVPDDTDVLPSTRTELLRTKKLTFTEPKTMRDALAHTGYQSQAMKEEILSRTPAAVQLQNSSDAATSLRIEPEVEEENPNLSLAKSWAVSTVMTTYGSLDSGTVADKLSSITPNKRQADQLFDRALRILQRNQVIKRTRGTTKGPWRVSERWFEMFEVKRMITAKMLKKAAAWKRDVLDPAVHAGQSVLIDKMQIMQDGEMVAIVNMVANGRCKITAGPAGLPRGRYGLDPEATSYNTKGMSRLLTLFATTIQPTEEYVAGDPVAAERLEIPSWQDNGKGKIPCWIDMSGNVIVRIWEMVVSAVVGLLSGRPGISPLEIERSFAHGVTKWEVESVLIWLEGGGFAQRTEYGTGWETREWWWMVCGFTDHDADVNAHE